VGSLAMARPASARHGDPAIARRLGCAAGLALALALSFALNGAGQEIPSQLPQPAAENPKWPGSRHFFQFGDADPEALRKRQRLLNAARQKELVSDTAKLLKLAQELNEEVTAAEDSTNMTADQLRKLAEIGKLARSVREKMTFSLGGDPVINLPIVP
jgi:hypothetical protein